MNKPYTILIITENTPGVLYRIADIFLKRKINIESLHVSETAQKGISQFTIHIKTESKMIEKVIAQIGKIIEVVEVFEKEDPPSHKASEGKEGGE